MGQYHHRKLGHGVIVWVVLHNPAQDISVACYFSHDRGRCPAAVLSKNQEELQSHESSVVVIKKVRDIPDETCDAT